MSNLILYHNYCPDGFSAAWIFHKKYPDAEFIGVDYKDKGIPIVDGKDVVIVDFCYPETTLLEIKQRAKSLIVLDHHNTAMEQCKHLDFCHFDMSKCGAGIAWEYLFKDQPIPKFIKYFEYRDLGYLWSKNSDQHPENLESLLSALDSYQMTFENWDLFEQLDQQKERELVRDGEVILRYKNKLIRDMMSRAYTLEIDGKQARCINSFLFTSELGNILAKESEDGVGVVWYNKDSNTKFSLRSTDDAVDVSKIAEKFNLGGGHKKAAGFTIKNFNMRKYIK